METRNTIIRKTIATGICLCSLFIIVLGAIGAVDNGAPCYLALNTGIALLVISFAWYKAIERRELKRSEYYSQR